MRSIKISHGHRSHDRRRGEAAPRTRRQENGDGRTFAGINAWVRPLDVPYVPPNDKSVQTTTSNITSAPLSRVLRGFVLLRCKATLNPNLTSPPGIAAGTDELWIAQRPATH
jgi:hypothetical protein